MKIKPRFVRGVLVSALAIIYAIGLIGPVVPAFADGQPVATLDVPSTGMIGETLNFSVTFDNTNSTDEGYGPYIDLVLPAAGADGAGAAVDDGITFTSATYLGTPLIPVIDPFICDATGSFIHPLTGLATTCTPGTQVVVLQLPFGSFTATQPAAEIKVVAEVSDQADLNTPLTISATAGFYLGNTPLADPATDPPIVSSSTSTTFTPELFKLKKTYLGTEDETATGPNFPRQYRIDIDIADGQTLTNLDITDLLPDNMQFVSVDDVLVNGVSVASTAIATPSTTTPGGTVTRRIATVTGTTAEDDVTLLLTFYIPYEDANGDVIIDPTSGDDVLSENNASTSGTWDPIDTRDATITPSIDLLNPEHILIDKSVAIQKSVANVTDASNSPGDTLEYTLDIQISDFFAFQDLVIDDILSDGQRWDTSFAPTLQVNGNSYVLSTAAIDGANYTITPNYTPASVAPNDGTTDIQFRLSDELVTRGQSAQLIGGCVATDGSGLISPCDVVSGSGDGPTTATITFRTVIQDEFSDDYPSGDASIDEGDLLHNDVTVAGAVLNNVGLTPTGETEDDDSATELEIARGELKKTIYAVNGVICATQPCTNVVIEPGDTVTYRLERDLITTDVEDLKLSDYLPLPIFDVDDDTAPVISRVDTINSVVSAAAPAAGEAKFGPADTFYAYRGAPPTIALDSVANSITFDYGTFDDTSNDSYHIDLLFTVTANSAPFADGMYLTNQLREYSGSTNAGDQVIDAIVQLNIFEPYLTMRKGVVAAYESTTDNTAVGTLTPSTVLPGGITVNAPGTCARINGNVNSGNLGTTFDSNLTGVDAGTRVTFSVIVENSGTSSLGAFDVRIQDALPTGVTLVPGSLCVTNGAGTVLTYTGAESDLFTTGIELVDPSDSQGALGRGKMPNGDTVTDGTNIAVVTYDVTVDSTVGPSQTLTNIATLSNYSSLPSGDDHTPINKSDDATVKTTVPALTKSITTTSEGSTPETGTGTSASPRLLTIGEIIRYRLAVALPEGTSTNLQLHDYLPNGLRFLNDGSARVAFVSNDGGITSTTVGAIPGISCTNDTGNSATALTQANVDCTLADANISTSSTTNGDTYTSGTDIYFKLGTITNDDRDADTEYVVVEFNAILENSTANNIGNSPTNNFRLLLDGVEDEDNTSNTVSARIVEPSISIDKSVTPTQADAGDEVTYTVQFANANTTNNTTAFDVAFSDVVPSQLTGVTLVSVSTTGAVVGEAHSLVGSTFTINATSMEPGSSITLVFKANLVTTVTPGQQITNVGNVTYTSLPGTNGTTGNSTGSNNTGTPGDVVGERTGSGTAPNDYLDDDDAVVTVYSPTPVKSLVSTSEGGTTGSNVAIGEIARYRLEVRIAEGTSPSFSINDALPAGMLYLNDGTTKLALVSTDSLPGGLTSSAVTDAAAHETGNDTTLSGITPSFVLPGSAISGGTGTAGAFQSGDDPVFSLGDLTNSDSDPDQEFVVIEFNALVLNVAGNQNGTGLANTFTVTIGSNTTSPSSAVAVTVAEPQISNVTKTITNAAAAPFDAGDTVNYQISYSNTGTATAYNVVLSDALPSGLTLNLGSVNVTLGGSAAGSTNSSSGNTVAVTVDTIPVGGTVTITFNATVNSTIVATTALNNQATVTYTSLPGTGTASNPTGSNTPGGSGDTNGERNGSGGINDYSDNDAVATTTATPAIDKLTPSPTNYTIGDTVTYQIRITLPEGVTNNLVVTDYLPDGLAYVSGSAAIDTAGYNGTMPMVSVSGGSANGADITFTFGGSITIYDDNDSSNNSFVVRLTARVLNVAANQDGSTLSNTAGLSYTNGSSTTVTVNDPVAETISLVEPKLTTDKQVLSTDGSTVEYQVVVNNTGSATAYDAVISDVLPSSLDLDTGVGAITISASGGATTGTADHDDATNTLSFTGVTIPVGGSVTITYQAAIVTPGVTISNTANATYTSLSGNSGTSGTESGERDGSGGVNDYTTSDGATLGSLGDTVWYDIDADGVQDAGEVGLSGVTVTITWFGPDGIAGNADDSVITTTTDASGNYLASGLPLGTGANNYSVTVDTATLPNGLTVATYDRDGGTTSPNSTVTLALTTTTPNPRDLDFGYRGTGSLGDFVWIDSDGDGAQDAGEPGLPGVTVNLTWYGQDGVAGGGDDVTYTTTTNASGGYSFTNLPSGNFVVAVDDSTLPDNVTQTYDLNGALDNSATRSLGIGEAATDVDFGYVGDSSIGDTVWYDVDGGGTQNHAEPGIPGATVTLVWGGPDGDLTTTGDNVTFTTTTDTNGEYLFEGLPVNGTDDPYRVTVTPPAGYTVQTYDNDGTGTANQSTLDLAPNTDDLDQDFGYRASATQALGDFVWEDLNGNGVQDTGEPGIGGVTVELYDSTGTNLLATTTTAADGSYSFTGLLAGDYQVHFVAPTDYVFTAADVAAATDATDSDANATTGWTGAVTVPSGAANTTVDAGLYQLMSVGDRVWYDIDGDGVQDAGEPGISGATVTITWYGPDGVLGGGDDQDFTTTTGTDGAWTIDDVPPGNYGTSVTNLPNGLTDQTAGPATFTMVSGTDRDDIDFGYTGTGSIGNFVWLDSNNDGVQDAGEPGLPGVTVELTWAGPDGDITTTSDNVTYSTTTDANGAYLFDNLPSGDFVVTVDGSTLPDNVTQTYDLDGTLDNSATRSLTAGENATDVDFGYVGTASIGDTVWYDVDGDGTQDTGEIGIAGATVTLVWGGPDGDLSTTSDNATFTTTTDANGEYLFEGLPVNGTDDPYQVTVALPTGSPYNTQTYDSDGTGTANQSTLNLGANENNLDQDFGYRGSASLGDLVWLDLDSDGTQDAGEPGLPGITVNLTWYGLDGVAGGGDDVTYTTTTDASGAYLFEDLPAGNFSVTVDSSTLPGNVTATYDLDGGADNTADRTLTAGENATDVDFGYVGAASIGDTVWYDINGDKNQDAGEPGIANATVELVWAGPDGILGNADDVTLTTTTDASGNYLFEKLPVFDTTNGDYYQVTVTLPTGTPYNEQTYDSDGADLTPNQSTLQLGPSEDNRDQDFGYRGTASLGDFVWLDLDADGVQDAGEPGLPGVTVNMTWYGPDGAVGGGDDVTYTTTTDANGAYLFGDLPSGSFSVTVDTSTLPSNITQTYDLNGALDNSATRTLAANENATDVDFGYAGDASIGDYVWLDDNGDGIQDTTEIGLPNVDVTLTWYGADGVLGGGDDVVIVTTTDANGDYLVEHLPVGNYQVDVDETDAPLATVLTTPDLLPVTLTAGDTYLDADFGFRGTTLLGDFVWLDANGDGVQQPGEDGIAGVTVTATWYGPDGVLGTADDVDYTATTDLNGYYQIIDVPAGEYNVTVSGAPLTGLNPTYDLDGTTTPSAATVTMTTGVNRFDVDFGFIDPTPTATGSIGDTVWLDSDGDGIQDGSETGISGVTVLLITPGADGIYGTADDTTVSDITDANGNYSFTGLPAGPYRVQIDSSTLPSSVVETSELDGSLNGLVDVGLAAGENRSDVDFGYRDTSSGGTLGSIGDRVWHDTDGDGVQDVGETGIAGATVTLTSAGTDGVFGTADDWTLTTTTDASGNYLFSDLPAGNYQVATSGTPLTSLYETYDLDGGLDNVAAVSLASGQNRSDVDFGYANTPSTATGSIGDRIWLDLNGDGVQDAGEVGLGGVTVELHYYGADGVPGGGDDVVYTQVTDANGNYNFTNLPAGNFAVTVAPATLPAGVAESYDLDGTLDGMTVVSLTTGQVRTDVDFGYVGTGSLGDRVWNDADGDRVQDTGEAGIAGVTMTLVGAGADGVFGTADDINATTITGAGGFYSFTGLPAGQYQVTASGAPLGGLNETYELDGSLDNSTIVALGVSQNRTDVDFGYTAGSVETGSIGDRVWLDQDGDGTQDTGEPGLPGVTVNLIAAGADGIFGTADDVVNTQITDANGNYNFTDLPAGKYQVVVDSATLPSGVTGTSERDATIDGSTDVTLTKGQVVTDADFGYQGSGSIGNVVWFDVDGDGVQDAGEPGLPGVTVTATWYGADGVPGGGDDITFTTVTGADGSYSFGGLPLGSYDVVVGSGLPGGMVGTAELDGTLNGNVQVDLTPTAPNRSDVDFGYTGTGSIGDLVWQDSDGDGLKDPSETGLGNVTVTLTWAGPDGVFGTADDLVRTTTTDSNGAYLFENLPAGKYQVVVDTSTLPSGMNATYDLDGGDDSAAALTLGNGQHTLVVDFGYQVTPTAITLSSFTASRDASGVKVRWTTSLELNTYGFHVLRSTTPNRADATRVSTSLILGKGKNGGSYEWVDSSADAGTTYYYWLEEQETTGTTAFYGPATVTSSASLGTRILLPMIVR